MPLVANSDPSSRAALAWAGSVPVDEPQNTHTLFKTVIGMCTQALKSVNVLFRKLPAEDGPITSAKLFPDTVENVVQCSFD